MTWKGWAKALGEFGGSFITDTQLHSGNWCAFQCVEPTKFHTLSSTFEGTPLADTIALVAYEYPAGFVLFGVFTDIKLHSGKIVAYKGE